MPLIKIWYHIRVEVSRRNYLGKTHRARPLIFAFSHLGLSLNDSPIGLAAYILEKFSTWTNKSWRDLPDGGLCRY